MTIKGSKKLIILHLKKAVFASKQAISSTNVQDKINRIELAERELHDAKTYLIY